MQENLVHFGPSAFAPVALGFFGLGTGYFVWGGQALFRFPEVETPEVSRSMGLWAFWMPGFMQFVTGIILFAGLTVFQGVFTGDPLLYMAALAFTAYGIHWFSMAHRRYVGASAVPDAWMACAFAIISVLGAVVFALGNVWTVAGVFIGLSLIYLTEIPFRFGKLPLGGRLVGFWQFGTGLYLMYLTWAVTLDLALGWQLPS
jgi:hypothetical protein